MSAGTRDATAIRARAAYVIQRVAVVVSLILVIRLAFKLFQASSGAPFVALLYRLTDPLVWPFHGIFKPSLVSLSGSGSLLFDWESLIAIVVYLLIARILASVLR